MICDKNVSYMQKRSIMICYLLVLSGFISADHGGNRTHASTTCNKSVNINLLASLIFTNFTRIMKPIKQLDDKLASDRENKKLALSLWLSNGWFAFFAGI